MSLIRLSDKELLEYTCRIRSDKKECANARAEIARRNFSVPKTCSVCFSSFTYARAYAYWDCVPKSHKEIPKLLDVSSIHYLEQLVRVMSAPGELQSVCYGIQSFLETAPTTLDKLNEKSLHVFFSPMVTHAIVLARRLEIQCTRYIEDNSIFDSVPFASGEMEFVVTDETAVETRSCLLLVEMKPGPTRRLSTSAVLGQAIAELFAGRHVSSRAPNRMWNILSNGLSVTVLEVSKNGADEFLLRKSDTLAQTQPQNFTEDMMVKFIAILLDGLQTAWQTQSCAQSSPVVGSTNEMNE